MKLSLKLEKLKVDWLETLNGDRDATQGKMRELLIISCISMKDI